VYSLSFVEEIWEYVTPTKEGIPTTKMFYEKVLSYTKSKDIDGEFAFCDLTKDKSNRPKLSEILNFLEGALLKDVPIAFLNLCNGDEKHLEVWHWVTIISLEYTEDGQNVSQFGEVKSILLNRKKVIENYCYGSKDDYRMILKKVIHIDKGFL
jgi:hypothetical protein